MKSQFARAGGGVSICLVLLFYATNGSKIRQTQQMHFNNVLCMFWLTTYDMWHMKCDNIQVTVTNQPQTVLYCDIQVFWLN